MPDLRMICSFSEGSRHVEAAPLDEGLRETVLDLDLRQAEAASAIFVRAPSSPWKVVFHSKARELSCTPPGRRP